MFPFGVLGRAKIAGEIEGFVKIVADKKYDEVLGVHMIGPRATELVAEATMALRLECTVEELIRTIHAHPTMSEAVGEAAHAAHGGGDSHVTVAAAVGSAVGSQRQYPKGHPMPTNVVMPQMGESVAEGTVVRWIKKVGDAVDRDEPLFEISTDKVDAEIPSPVAGLLVEIRVKEGETVPVDSVVAVIAAGRRAGGRRAGGRAVRGAARPGRATGRPRPGAPAPPSAGRPEPPGTAPDDARGRARRASAHAVVAARPAHRPGARRRHQAAARHRHRRPRHQAATSSSTSRRARRRRPQAAATRRRAGRRTRCPPSGRASASRSCRCR